MSRRPQKSAAKAVQVPASLGAVEELQAKVTDLIAAIEAHKAAGAAKIERIASELETRIAPLRDDALRYAKQIHAYAEANRAALTEGGKTKTARLGNSGRVEWATSPPAVSIRKAADVLETLKQRGLVDFIRHPPAEIDKDAMLKDQERAKTVPGVTISQANKVYVRLTNSRAHIESTIGKKGSPGVWTIVWPKDEEKGE